MYIQITHWRNLFYLFVTICRVIQEMDGFQNQTTYSVWELSFLFRCYSHRAELIWEVKFFCKYKPILLLVWNMSYSMRLTFTLYVHLKKRLSDSQVHFYHLQELTPAQTRCNDRRRTLATLTRFEISHFTRPVGRCLDLVCTSGRSISYFKNHFLHDKDMYTH